MTSRSLAILRRPKFQFNSRVAGGLAASFGMIPSGRKDHFVNRPYRVFQGHWPTGEVRQKFVVRINTKREG